LGQHVKQWNPSLTKFLLASRLNFHILNIRILLLSFQEFVNHLQDIVRYRGLLIIASENPSTDPIMRKAVRRNFFIATDTWTGGIITNFKTLAKKLIYKFRTGKIPLTRKEQKRARKVQGMAIEFMQCPSILFTISSGLLPVNEAQIMGIPSAGLIDSDCYSYVDYPIPANFRSLPSSLFFVRIIQETVILMKQSEKFFFTEFVVQQSRAKFMDKAKFLMTNGSVKTWLNKNLKYK
jgi:small subunit ribosomal protein S2